MFRIRTGAGTKCGGNAVQEIPAVALATSNNFLPKYSITGFAKCLIVENWSTDKLKIMIRNHLLWKSLHGWLYVAAKNLKAQLCDFLLRPTLAVLNVSGKVQLTGFCWKGIFRLGVNVC